MRNPHKRCERKKFVRQTKSASNAKKARVAYADSSSSSDDYPIESSDSEGSDDCPRDCSGRRGKQVKAAPISSPVEELSEGNPSEDEPVEPDDLQMPSKDYALHHKKEKNYVLQGKFDLTAAQKAKVDALDEKIRPKIPMLVVRMKKTNVKQYPDLAILKDYAVNHFPSKNQTITLKLHGKSKEWLCDFRIIPDEKGHHLYLHEFVHDNNVREGDLCLFQPMTKGDVRNFKVTVHHLREASVDHSPVERNDIGANDGAIQEKSADSVDIQSSSGDHTKQPSGRKIYPSCQRGSSRDHRNTAKKAAKPTSFEKSGGNSPLAYNSIESDDRRTPRGHNYALSLGSCLSGAQYEKVIALVERIQPGTAVYVDVMSQRAVEPPSPLLIIPEGHAIAHFPNESVTIALQAPDKRSNKWHPRFYMTKDRSEYMLIGHWLDFVYDNRVQEGDICIFVPEKCGRRSKFTVHLLHGETSHSGGGTGDVQGAGSGEGENASSESNMHRVSHEHLERKNSDGLAEPPYILPSMSHLSLSQENIVEAKVQAIQSEVPIYVSIMKKTYIGAIKHNMLELSSRYAAAAHLPRENQTVVPQCMSRVWKTKMVVHRNGKRWFLSAGWSKFVHDNSLQLGDICLFELMKNKRKPTMKVHIIPSKQR